MVATKRLRWIAAGVVLGVASTAGAMGIASAVIPGPGGVVNGCYKIAGGALRVRDSAAHCGAGERGLNWNQKGVKGPKGATGVVGPTGVVTTASVAGYVGASIAGSSTSFVFAGPTAEVSMVSGQRLTGSASAVLGIASGTQLVDFGLCFSTDGGATRLLLAGSGSFQSATADATRRVFASASTGVVSFTGTVQVGYCVNNGGATALTLNDWVNGFFQVTN